MPTFGDPLNGVSYSEALKEAWTHGDSEVVFHTTVTLSNPQFVDSLGNQIEHRLVRDYVDLQATLEADAPMNPGQEVTFQACPFNFSRPSEVDDSAPTEMTFTIDNVSREIKRALDQTLGSFDVTTITVREYLSSDTSAPHNDPPLVLELQGATVDLGKVQARAAYGNAGNRRFPADTYDRDRFPGLEP